MISKLLKILRGKSVEQAAGDDSDFSTVSHIYNAQEHSLLYHYTSAEAAIGILENQNLRLSEFSKTNDESEYLYARSKFLEHYHNRDVYIEETPRYLNSINLVRREFDATMMIGCLTDRSDDFMMWNSYASQFSGCVIGFNAAWLSNRAGVAIRRVSYDPDYFRTFVQAGLAMLQKQYEEAPDDTDALNELSMFFILDLFAFKDPRFQSESEIRISRLVLRDPHNEGAFIDSVGHRSDKSSTPTAPVLFREGKHGVTPYIELPLVDSTGCALRTIKLGRRISQADRNRLHGLASQIGNIEITDSDIPVRF